MKGHYVADVRSLNTLGALTNHQLSSTSGTVKVCVCVCVCMCVCVCVGVSQGEAKMYRASRWKGQENCLCKGQPSSSRSSRGPGAEGRGLGAGGRGPGAEGRGLRAGAAIRLAWAHT